MLSADFAARLAAASAASSRAQLDALLVTPGPDLRYLVGYDAVPLERLTCLVVRPGGEPVLVAPALERATAEASPAGDLGIEIATWQETDDPYALVASLAGAARVVALDDHMWASKVLALRSAMPGVEQVTANRVLGEMRMRKSAHEVEALQRAADAIDRVHAAVPSLLRLGRSEREVGRDIAELIITEGHVRADFVIVASGPNSASPHHEVSDRELRVGDAIVVDIGGTTAEGYCSDETRTYALGDPGDDYRAAYDALQVSQATATAAVRPGASCESIDEAARQSLTGAGLGEYFIHRTGHGIGLETHEEPYIVTGNERALEPGMAFSIEPGFYIPGRFGARIEDIVVCGPDGAVVLNARPRELVMVEP